MEPIVFDNSPCVLGEGPLWHPKRNELFWFDIIGNRLNAKSTGVLRHYEFGEHASAAGWIDENTLLVATETALKSLDLTTETLETVCPLDAGNELTRSNDGRADPWGGFWIGTMGKKGEPEAGAIYRYYRGEVRVLYNSISISNSICFDPSGTYACFTDTPTRKIMRQKLSEKDGWPEGEPELYLDFTGEPWGPDGAVIDASGNFWNAQWNASRVACYDVNGAMLRSVDFPAPHTTCPAFGGDDLTTLFCTSALQGLSEQAISDNPRSGMTFEIQDIAQGQAEHQVTL